VKAEQAWWRPGVVAAVLLLIAGFAVTGVAAAGHARPLPVAGVGLVISVLLARLVHHLFASRRQALGMADAAVQQLRRAESDSQRDAALLSAVLDSIGDGVGVVDRNGRFLLHNRAAKALLGIQEDVDDPEQWQQHYGIFQPDGVTPFPEGELPLMRALNGDTTNMVDMFIRNPGHPEGVMISVSGRPPGAGAWRRACAPSTTGISACSAC
jgi:PAS domain-containing protein